MQRWLQRQIFSKIRLGATLMDMVGWPQAALANRRLQPLGHVSASVVQAFIKSRTRSKPKIATGLRTGLCVRAVSFNPVTVG